MMPNDGIAHGGGARLGTLKRQDAQPDRGSLHGPARWSDLQCALHYHGQPWSPCSCPSSGPRSHTGTFSSRFRCCSLPRSSAGAGSLHVSGRTSAITTNSPRSFNLLGHLCSFRPAKNRSWPALCNVDVPAAERPGSQTSVRASRGQAATRIRVAPFDFQNSSGNGQTHRNSPEWRPPGAAPLAFGEAIRVPAATAFGWWWPPAVRPTERQSDSTRRRAPDTTRR